MVAMSSLFGYAGNLLATVPLSILLHDIGWQPTFAGAALASLVGGVAVLAFIPAGPVGAAGARQPATEHEAPAHEASAHEASAHEASAHEVSAHEASAHEATGDRIRAAWRAPGTRLGFWLHFSCMSTATVFGTLWGLPFLVAGGFTDESAGAVLLVCVVVAVAASVAVGSVTAARPGWRVPVGLAVCGGTVLGWGALLALGGNHPAKAVVVLLVAATACGGPASSIGFALARDYNRPAVVGTATGLVNVGGFIATILGTAAVGLILDVTGHSGPGAFRLAFAAVVALQLFGTCQVLAGWLRLRAEVLDRQDGGIAVPVPVHRHPWDLVGPTGA
jgi:sugar phosphate permease